MVTALLKNLGSIKFPAPATDFRPSKFPGAELSVISETNLAGGGGLLMSKYDSFGCRMTGEDHSKCEDQMQGYSTRSQRPEEELRTAASTNANPLTPSSTTGKSRSISSGDLWHNLATTAFAKSE